MDKLYYFKRREKEINELRKKIKELKEKGGVTKFLLLDNKIKKLKTLEKIQDEKVDQLLLQQDSTYRDLAIRNVSLLENHDLVFDVLSYNSITERSSTKRMEGQINESGESYSQTTVAEEMIPFLYTMRFPAEFIGSINHYGAIELITSRFRSILFKAIPDQYFGFIDSDGKIKLGSSSTGYSIFQVLNTGIGNMVAKHFENDELSRYEFMHNRKELIKRLEEFRMNLLTA